MTGIIIIDKPSDWTSHDVIGKLRGILREKRIGHGGTLDPMATGVLPVFVGRATRAVSFCENAEKEYIAEICLGTITDTQDTTGTVLETRDVSVTETDLLAVLPQFTGIQEQIPPMYSAVKIGGKKLYELARRGIEIERKARHITIKELSLLGKTSDGYELKIVCSKGTYVRTLCHDIGTVLGCGAAMSALRRTRAGVFTLTDSVSIEAVQRAKEEDKLSDILRPVDSLFANHPAIIISEAQTQKCRNGNAFSISAVDGTYRIYAQSGEFLMLADIADGVATTIKSFFEVY